MHTHTQYAHTWLTSLLQLLHPSPTSFRNPFRMIYDGSKTLDVENGPKTVTVLLPRLICNTASLANAKKEALDSTEKDEQPQIEEVNKGFFIPAQQVGDKFYVALMRGPLSLVESSVLTCALAALPFHSTTHAPTSPTTESETFRFKYEMNCNQTMCCALLSVDSVDC